MKTILVKERRSILELLARNRSPPPPHGIYEVTLMLCNYFPTFNRLGSNYSSEQSRSSSRFSGRSIFSANRAISTLHWRLKEASWHFLSRQSTGKQWRLVVEQVQHQSWLSHKKTGGLKAFFLLLQFHQRTFDATCVLRKETNSYGISNNNTS